MMKQGKINTAFGIVCDFYRIKGLPYALSRDLFLLKKKIEPYFEHYSEQEFNLLSERNALNPDGTIRRDVPQEEVTAINKELNDMRSTEVEWKEEPLTVKLTSWLTEKLGVTGELIEQLDGIICFEEKEDDEE